MGEADVGAAVGGVVAVLHAAGRSEGTIRRYQAVLDRFAAFLAGRGLSTASDQACVDFIARQTGTRLGALREPVTGRDVQAVRRPVVLMADALAGRAVVIDRPVIPVKYGCPAGFRLLRDDYVASCRARGNAEATLVAKGKAASRFLGYLAEMGAGDLTALGVRDVSGFCCGSAGCGARCPWGPTTKARTGRGRQLASFCEPVLSSCRRSPGSPPIVMGLIRSATDRHHQSTNEAGMMHASG